MKRTHDKFAATCGKMNTAPGNPPAVLGRADPYRMQPTPGAVPPSETLYHLARAGDKEALSSLTREAVHSRRLHGYEISQKEAIPQ